MEDRIKELETVVNKLTQAVKDNMEFIRLCGIVFEKKGIATRKELEEAYNDEKKKFDDLVKAGEKAGFVFDKEKIIKDDKEYSYEDLERELNG